MLLDFIQYETQNSYQWLFTEFCLKIIFVGNQVLERVQLSEGWRVLLQVYSMVADWPQILPGPWQEALALCQVSLSRLLTVHRTWQLVSRKASGSVIEWKSLCPGGSDSKESACNARDLCWIPGLGRSPREGNGNPLQYSCLENSMDRGAWWTIVHGITKSWARLSD